MRSVRFAALAALGLLSFTGPASASLVFQSGTNDPSFNPNPNNYGFAHSGVGFSGMVAFLVVENPDGTFAVYHDSTVGPYDGAEDTQMAVLNRSSTPLASITLSGPSNFVGFDFDGIDTFGSPGNSHDNTGYGGPNTFFTGFSSSSTSVTANFVNPLTQGQSTYFSLELSPSALNGGGGIGVTTPEPNSLALAGSGLVVALGYLWRRRRRS
jgi:hypothetical protein